MRVIDIFYMTRPKHLDWERSQYRLDVLPIAVDYPYRAPYAYAEYALYEPKHLEEA